VSAQSQLRRLVGKQVPGVLAKTKPGVGMLQPGQMVLPPEYLPFLTSMVVK
jgi:hypothetical protein